MWDRSVKLISTGKPYYDGEGLEAVETEEVSGVPASFKDVTRSDQVLAQQSGYQADQVIILMACNYAGQRQLKDESTGEMYHVRRIYRADKSMEVQLTCERRDAGGAL